MEVIIDDLIKLFQDLAIAVRIPTSFLVFEFVGTFAFALSGIRMASAKKFDIFGAWIVGMATAIGGGTMRDVMLGLPPFWMENSIYFIWCALAVVFVMFFSNYLVKRENTWFVFDTIGLALFNVVGIEKTMQMGFPWWTCVAMGSVTGAAGGVIRDVLINEVPLIFRKEIYALACISGGVVYIISHAMGLDLEVCALVSSIVVIMIRTLAVKYHWHLPIVKGGACLLLLCSPLASSAIGTVYSPEVRSLQVICNDNPLLPAALQLGSKDRLVMHWDEMSHEYHRYIYRIEHCEWDWTPSEGLFESDWLQGNNNQPIELNEKSFNTSQIYTHYALMLPNSDVRFLLSGNYRVRIFMDEDEDEENCVLEARFVVYENLAPLSIQLSSNTDIDFNKSHQQVSLALSYGPLRVIDPASQIHTVVVQNRRREVSRLTHNIQKASGIEYTHNRQLIFPAGNEFHKFEILDVHKPSMGVDNMRWYDPYYHATLWEDRQERNYINEEDQNGAFIIRNQDNINNHTETEYLYVHFSLRSPRLPQDVYVAGQWTNGTLDPECLMEYDEVSGTYHAAVLLKQGYYNYEYIQADGSTLKTMGDYWETENEYQAYVYYREQGGRYDRLIAYHCVHSAR